jgi:hypothetical protein
MPCASIDLHVAVGVELKIEKPGIANAMTKQEFMAS